MQGERRAPCIDPATDPRRQTVCSSITLNLPLAVALGTVPVLIIVGYLLAVRRTGALSSL